MLFKVIGKVAVWTLANWARSKGKKWVVQRTYGSAHRWLKGEMRPLEVVQLDFRVINVGERARADYGGSAARYFTALREGEIAGLPESVFPVPDGDGAVAFFYNPEQIRVEEVMRYVHGLDVDLEFVSPL